MKLFIKKNILVIILFFATLVLLISLFTKTFGMEEYKKVDQEYGIVNTEYLNLRSGTNIKFDSIDLLTKNEYVRIYGKINDWYIVQSEENRIGAVHQNYITTTNERKVPSTNIEKIKQTASDTVTLNLSSDEQKILSLVNDERKKNNLPDLQIDENLQNVARLKANDIIENNYFAHISPVYGTPFEMLKSNNINYKTASENIAGNASLDDAFNSWINSESHKANILSNTFNYTGIAVVDSIAYGKIIVELFIGK